MSSLFPASPPRVAVTCSSPADHSTLYSDLVSPGERRKNGTYSTTNMTTIIIT